jgi:hypothetical protein
MGADLSRIRSNPLLDFAGVDLKQGGVLLDADFNELVAVVDRRLRAAASDILGPATASSTTPDAFKLTVVAGALTIGKGRLYVDGLLAESHGAASDDPAKQLFDPLLSETSFADLHTYATQPYLPNPPALPTGGAHLVYLDVWEREVTNLERPELVEVAVGVETSSRRQTVWQVRVLGSDAGNASCGSPDADFSGWAPLIAPSTGRLTTGTFDTPPETDPCELPPTGGYRGLENQTYRVEIHDAGQPGSTATFKWSRENASVGSRVVSMVSGTEFELQSLGRDDVLCFASGDWVEIIDDRREFSQACGEMRKITVNVAARRITFMPALPAEMLPATFPNVDFPRDGNLRVRRWDQKHQVLRTGTGGTTTVFQDLDAGSTGTIPVPAAGTTLILENGVTVSFASSGTTGFRAGDHWVFAARTADASVELLEDAPPRGIHHHYARLGIWTVGSAGDPTDCRHPWPPVGGGHDCSCTECVTPESHASGQLTIQGAVDRIRATGGTVCLGVGQYVLAKPVTLADARSVRIRGQGAATLLITPGTAFEIRGGIAIAIDDLAVLSVGQASAITVRTVIGLSLQRLIVAVLGGNNGRSAAVALAGAVIGTTLRDNLLVAPVGVLANEPGPTGQATSVMLSALLRIEDNAMWCQRRAVSLAGLSAHLMATRITGNEILGCRQGALTMLGLAGPGASTQVRGNSINVSGPGVTAGVNGLWIADNELVGTTQGQSTALNGAGIHLRTGLDPTGADQCQLLANQISGFDDAGILIESPVASLIVKLNIIHHCGNGIVSQGEAKGGSVAIENNQLADIGGGRASGAAEVVGIAVMRAESAAVAGNTLRRIGLLASQALLRVGVAASAVQRLRVAGNDVMDIGPPGNVDGGFAVGVLVRSPFAEVEVSHNQVDRESVPLNQGGGRFLALWIDEPGPNQPSSQIGTMTTIRVDASTTLTLGAGRAIIDRAGSFDVSGTVIVRGANASVLGNNLRARGATPVVRVIAAGDCLFSDNRCELRGADNKLAVQLASGIAIVSSNRVRGGEVSIDIESNPKTTTVLGNVTTGSIELAGTLGTPWAALNVRG